MDITRINTSQRMSQIVIHGNTIYLAGQVGQGETVEAQTTVALNEVQELLKLAGSDVSRILSATIWLASMSDFDAMNSVWDDWVDSENAPARACGESRLASPEYLVEIMIVAAKE